MAGRQAELASGRAVGAQLVGHELVRSVAQLLQQLAHEFQGRRRVAPRLDQQVQHLAFAVHRSPQIHLFPTHTNEHLILSANSPERGAEGDPCSPPSMSACSPQLRSTAPNGGAPATEPIRRQYQHLVQVPSAVWLQASGPQPSGNCRTEGEDPSPDTLVRDHDAPLSQELLDIAEAEGEPEIHPDCVPDDLGWELMAGIGDGLHTSTVPRSVPTRPPCRDKAERDARGSGP